MPESKTEARLGREVYWRQQTSQQCRRRALRRLAGHHPDEFRALEDEERLKAGLLRAGASAFGRVPRDPR